MEQRHRDILSAKRLEITSDLRFRDIRSHLVDNGILRGADLDDIENKKTRGEEVKALLDILPNRGPNAFVVFRDALKNRYPHLARILNDDGQDGAATENETRVFIIHAGEDKESFVRPLVSKLLQQGLAKKQIFFDDVSIKPGEVIRDRIISTLSSQSLQLAVIVVSTSLLNKHYWPKLEFETCLRNNKRIFPIWVDSNDDKFKAFSELVGKYSPTLKQMSARRVQRDSVTGELPNIAAEVAQRLSTQKCTSPAPAAIQALLLPELSPSLSASSSRYEENSVTVDGRRARGVRDEQWVENELKDAKARQLELNKKLGENQIELLKRAEGLLTAEEIAKMTKDLLTEHYQCSFQKIRMGCAIVYLVPKGIAALERFWRDYNSGQLGMKFSQYLITDEMRRVVSKDLFIRVIVLEEQYRQWKHYFDATEAAGTVREFQSLTTAPVSSVEDLKKELGALTAQLKEMKKQLAGKEMEIQGLRQELELKREAGELPWNRPSFSRHFPIPSSGRSKTIIDEFKQGPLGMKGRYEEALSYATSKPQKALLPAESKHKWALRSSGDTHGLILPAIEHKSIRRLSPVYAMAKKKDTDTDFEDVYSGIPETPSLDLYRSVSVAGTTPTDKQERRHPPHTDHHCSNCGNRNKLGYIYCDFCGLRVEDAIPMEQNTQPSPPPRSVPGTSISRADSALSPLYEEVNCHYAIHHYDIARFLRNRKDNLSEKNRLLLQESLKLVTNESTWVWTNAQLTVHARHLTQDMEVVFYSGDRTYQYVVHLNEVNRPAYVVEKRGWKLKARDAVKTCWGWIKKAAGAIAGALTGGLVRGAIGGS